MYFYVLCCLFDLTKTGVLSYKPSANTLHQRNQQRNWQVINQLIQLRTQSLLITDPKKIQIDLNKVKLDLDYSGKHSIWYTVFAVDRDQLYSQKQDSVFALKQDFHQIPMIVGLDETANFPSPCLQTFDNQKNICFYTKEQWNNQIDIDFKSLETQYNGK